VTTCVTYYWRSVTYNPYPLRSLCVEIYTDRWVGGRYLEDCRYYNSVRRGIKLQQPGPCSNPCSHSKFLAQRCLTSSELVSSISCVARSTFSFTVTQKERKLIWLDESLSAVLNGFEIFHRQCKIFLDRHQKNRVLLIGEYYSTPVNSLFHTLYLWCKGIMLAWEAVIGM